MPSVQRVQPGRIQRSDMLRARAGGMGWQVATLAFFGPTNTTLAPANAVHGHLADALALGAGALPSSLAVFEPWARQPHRLPRPNPRWLGRGLRALLWPMPGARFADACGRAQYVSASGITAIATRAGRALFTSFGNLQMTGVGQGQTFSRVALIVPGSLATGTIVTSRNTGADSGSQWRITAAGEHELLKASVASIGVSSGSALAVGKVSAVGVTYNGSTAAFYTDGQARGTATSAQTFTIDTGVLFARSDGTEGIIGSILLYAEFPGLVLSPAEMMALTANVLALYAAAESVVITAAPAGSPSLVVADAAHAQAADAVALTQAHQLAAADATHAHQADAPTLTQVHALAAADAVHAHTAGGVTLDVSVTLATADATHAHQADAPTLTQAHQLTSADATHAHTAQALDLTQVHALAAADAMHAHSADHVTPTQAHLLAVADAVHPHSAEHITLSSALSLAIADALHGHSAEAFALTQAHALAVADALHGHAADGVTLGLTATLAVADALHAHAAGAVALGQVHVMVVSDAVHEQLVDGVTLFIPTAVIAGERCLLIATETRALVVVAESRAVQILAEWRRLSAEHEARVLQVAPEIRAFTIH